MKPMNKEWQIQNILKEFDFKRVRKVMKALDWEYEREGFRGIPSEKSLKQTAKRLLKSLETHKTTRVESGGFVGEDDDGYLSLHFVVEEKYYYPPEDGEEEYVA